MKVFIAGPRAIKKLDEKVIKKLNTMVSKEFTILVGDANGIDTVVQNHFAQQLYKNVVVYASEGKARNNIGGWNVENVSVKKGIKGFQYYAAKDLKMAEDADCGLMIWNGESRGTLNNILNLISMDKKVMVYFQPQREFYAVKSFEDVESLINLCEQKTKELFDKLLSENKQIKEYLENLNFQLMLNIV
ncbi:hypothetical protein [Anaerotignum sp.]|nr:hypothetical protein [Anaerotignum sp.]MBQ7759138.1 hypothetical protein [Anaerotignum sp.]